MQLPTIHRFDSIEVGDKFVTFANDSAIVWIKLANERNFLAGETDDGYTCPQPNAVTLDGFGACFGADKPVLRYDVGGNQLRFQLRSAL